MKLTKRSAFDLFWVVFMGGIFITALGYNRKAGLIPLLVAGPCAIMAIFTFFKGLKGKPAKGIGVEEALVKGIMEKMEGVSMDQVAIKKKQVHVDPAERQKRFWGMMAYMAGFVLGVYLFGHLIAIPLFVFFFMFLNKEKWWVALACAIATTVIVYVAFVVAAQTTLYPGVLYDYFFEVD